MTQPFSLSATYVHLRPDESAVALDGGDAFWAGIAERTDLEHGRLMGEPPKARTGTIGSAIPPARRS
jgi:hypothetical protein